jgi:hypothetical protein|eukprot:COSAG01_NODE_1410_length_10411_cov_7.944337_13_plen_466_part_00
MTDRQLKEATGRAPIPWWWPEPDPKAVDGGGGRAPTPHEAFMAQEADPHTVSRKVYVHWLYAKTLGYQGFSIPIGKHGKLTLTTPSPKRGRHTKMITARAVEAATAQQLFAELSSTAALSGTAPGPGPVLDLLPHGCAFAEAAEFSFDIGATVGDYRGDALFCALRKDTEDSPWTPLASDERLCFSSRGVATVELRSFCRVMVIWIRGLEEATTQAVVEMLATGLLAGMQSRGEEPNAAFRASFRLGCVVAVQVSPHWSGEDGLIELSTKSEVRDAMEAQVQTAVFADTVRKEEEAAAAAEALRLEEEAAAAEAERVAALPAALRQAAKDGHVDDYEVVADDGAKSIKDGIHTLLAAGVPVDGVDDKGYTALYNATMYEKPAAVAVLLKAGAEVDKENNNQVTPLMAAARDGFTAIVKLLLEAGANVAQVDEFGRTADSVAKEKGFDETAQLVTDWIAAHPAAAP